MYNGRTNPVEHVCNFNQRMAINSKNEVLMCKVFPSSLGSVAMRWFDCLGEALLTPLRRLLGRLGLVSLLATGYLGL